MKVTYYLPAHSSYFKDDDYSQAEVTQAISYFQMVRKPEKLGTIPEEFVFLTEPGKAVTCKFDSTEMGGPDATTTDRWVENTMKFAQAQLKRLVEEITFLLKGVKKQGGKTHP